jgi:hypothetical protein
MSKATIVSGAPFQICETHPQCVPYEIKLPPADFMNKDIRTLTLSDGYHALYIDWKRGFIDVPDDAIALAARTVRDILQAQFIYDPEVHPAIFFIPEEISAADVKKRYADVLKEQLLRQQRWFEVLVRRADVAYNKNRNLAEISDIHRAAALFLGLEREWCDKSPGAMVPCPACFTLVRNGAAVCYACRAVVDAEKYKTIHFVGEQK